MVSNQDWLRRIERMAGKSILHIQPVQRGCTPAARWLVDFANGATAFAKIGVTPDTAHWLRKEQQMYEALDGSFMPQLLCWEDGEYPILLLEYLSRAHWPPPWDEGHIRQVLDTLPDVWASSAPGLDRIEHFRGIAAG